MPRLTTYALDLDIVQKISTDLIKETATLIGCPDEYVTLQVNQDVFLRAGQIVKGDPYIEVCMFEREQEKEDQLALLLTDLFKRYGIAGVDIYLTHLSRRRYYENGEHF